MTEFLELLIDPASSVSQTRAWVDFCDDEAQDVPLLGLNSAATGLESSVQLDFEDLSSCTIVDCQFEAQGVTFANAIALRPSNPAYRSDSGEIVLMGAPKAGYLEARFLRPVQFVSGSVTSSRRTVLTVFDEHNQTIASTETPGTNLADSHAAYPANMPLHLSAANIHRVTFHAFDGQLTLADFCFNPA
jgi:hypothetical protein